MIYLLSPRSGGPYKQLRLVARALNKSGREAVHCYKFKDWLRLHFNKRDKIVSVVPFLFVRNKNNFILNIRGNYYKEKSLSNPISYLYDRNIRMAGQIVVPSRYLKNKLKINEAKVIPTSTDVNFVPKEVGKAKDDNKIRLATVTNFDFLPKARGVNKLINIANQLDTDKQVTIHVYGGGKWLNHAKEQFKTHNHKKFPVKFHGYFDNAFDVLPGNDIFIYWSTFDNMPNVLIEAIACGLPIVANHYAAFEEILGTNMLLAESEDDFARHLSRLIEDPDLRKNVERNNLRRAKVFHISESINKWIDVIEAK